MTGQAAFDVVIVGAGVAGLASAATLREHRVSFAVVEAGGRVGGRAWTVRPRELGGQPVDLGATWLHAVDRNPIVAMAKAAGEALVDAEAVRHRRTFVGGRLASAAELEAYDRAWGRFETAAELLLAAPCGDPNLAEVARRMQPDPWALTVEMWEGPIIAAAPADRLSLLDWHDNQLAGPNLMVETGLGDLVRRRLGEGIEVHLNTPAERIRWHGPGGRITVETPGGNLTAEACIVTVSTGVLAGEGIRFEPPLPAATRACIEALPMGLAIRVALRASGPDRLDLPPFCTVDRQVRPGDPAVVFNFWPFGRDIMLAWIGGDTAWDVEREGRAAAVDLVRSELRTLFGARADRVFGEATPVVTDWGCDKLFAGAYAYATPGQAKSRRGLGEPLADGRLLIAGEACRDDGLAGTVGGAYLSGVRAAEMAIAALRAR